MKYEQIKERLYSLRDEKYQKFQSKLCPGVENIIGVRIPNLRQIAKEIAKGDWREFLMQAKDNTYEEIMLQGLVIGYAKTEFQDIKKYIIEFIPKIDNWAVCDSFCNSLKITEKNRNEMLEFLLPYFKTKQEYQIRFAVIMLLNYYLTDEYIESVFKILSEIKQEEYYVKMGVAWTLSMCYVKYPERTIVFLNTNQIDEETYQKTLQKIIESNQVDQETKMTIRQMKRKIKKTK